MFFFQAEDGIRDVAVTGVQTCALPISARDVRRVLDVLTRCGFKTEIAFDHWLAKAHHGEKFIDVIYSSGNAVAEVDDEWFAHAVDETVLGTPVKLVPAEEMIDRKSTRLNSSHGYIS